MFAQTLRGEKSLQEMFDYYLGYLDGATPPTHHTFVNGNSHPYARQWGMQVALQDARAVVLQGAQQGQAQGHPRRALARRLADHRLRRLGLQRAARPQGHRSAWSRSTAACWEASTRSTRWPRPQAAIDDLSTGNPFADLLGFGIPEITGLFAEVGGIYAQLAPNSLGRRRCRASRCCRPQFNPPVPGHHRRGCWATPSTRTPRRHNLR